MVMHPEPGKFPSNLRHALSAVVSLRSIVPEDAFTAETLGTERAGYGAIIRSSGLVLTIGYLTAEAETIWISTADGKIFPGHVLCYDFETGFGLVQILARVDLPALALGSSAEMRIGDDVIVAGAGSGGETLVARIVARQEFAGYWEYAIDDALFTAPAHPHWGGTAVLNLAGELIGIGSLLVQGASEDNVTENINMVVPIDLLKPRLDDLVTTGRPKGPPRPWLGLFATEISGRVVVISVSPHGPAAASPLSRGDVVTAVAGSEVAGLGDFFHKVWALGPAGVEVPLAIERDGASAEITVRSGDRNSYLKAPTAH